MCAFAVRMVFASAILMRWLRCCRRHWYALFLVLNLLNSSLARTSSAESLIAYRCLVTVDGRGASLNCVSTILLWVYRVGCIGYRVFCGRPCAPEFGLAGGVSLFAKPGFGRWYWLRFGGCSRALCGLLGGCRVFVLIVSRSLRFAWVCHAFAFLRRSTSCALSGGGSVPWISAQHVYLAVSSIPV
jgi:hypothetical protein